MVLSRQRAFKMVAAFLVFAIAQLYVQASLTSSTAYAQGASLGALQGSGMLTTTGNRKIQVDKHDASTGATILDGMLLETPDCVAATVRWSTKEEVSLGTNTIAVVNQSKAKVTVSLKQGCAIVRGGEYEDLTIETPDGQVMTAMQFDGPPARKSGQVCYPSDARSEFSPTCLGAAPLSPVSLGVGSTTAGVVAGAIGEITLIVVAVLNTRGDNPSPMNP